MTDPFAPGPPPQDGQPAYGQQPQGAPYAQPAPYGAPAPGTPGQIRPTGKSVLLFFVTFGIYGFVYYYKVHEELKTHTGRGLGGAIALVIYFVAGLVSPFLLSDEVGKLYSSRNQQPPVTAVTGLWVVPGILLLLIGPFIWFAKTNGALNDYWKSIGVQA